MAHLAGMDSGAASEQEIFEKHVAPWMGRFFTDLEGSRTANFYARVGALGRTFIAIETEAFGLPH
jgi:TorA maturation chaperone TorD